MAKAATRSLTTGKLEQIYYLALRESAVVGTRNNCTLGGHQRM